MSKDIKELSDQQVLNLLRIALGPPEEWDESDADFVLRANGITPEEAPSRFAGLVHREIASLKQRGEEVPKELSDLHTRLIKKAELNEPLREAKARIQSLFEVATSISARVVHVYGRRVKKLSENDKRILQELASELLSEEKAKNPE